MAENYNTKDVTDLINRYLEAYQRRDISALGDVVARDANFVAFGSDEGETWYGWDKFRTAAEQLFAFAREIHWNRGTPRVTFSRDGNCAWFAEEMTGNFLTGEGKHECKFRLSGIAEKRGGQWVLVQFHRSVPTKEYAVPYLGMHGVRFD